jgi:hypothetical protein
MNPSIICIKKTLQNFGGNEEWKGHITMQAGQATAKSPLKINPTIKPG